MDTIRRVSEMTAAFRDPSSNYYLANIFCSAGKYEEGNGYFSLALDACENISEAAVQMLKMAHGEIGDKAIDMMRSAILCNWANLPHHGQGRTVDLDMTIEMYRASGSISV